ncbi:MAG: FAD-dependent oxidoreductase [archaeon]
MQQYDVAIIGAGPAGLMAAVYAGRYKLKTIVIGELHGGTIGEAITVCNFPTYTEISGTELSQKMVNQVTNLGINILGEKINVVEKNENGFLIKGSEKVITAKKVILAIGTKRKHLGLPKENEFSGKGVSYCSACDGMFFVDKVVGVVGGSDSALTAAIHLADIAKKVYIFYRKDKFSKAEPTWVEMVLKNKKILPVFNSNIVELIGERKLEGVKLDNGKQVVLNGLFIEIGSEPKNEFLSQMKLKTDKEGYVLVDKLMRTNVHGIFSAGDLNSGNFKQAVIATAEGAIAANAVYEEVKYELNSSKNKINANK